MLCVEHMTTPWMHIKFKLFPSTLKAHALRWFMGLGNKGIATWETMKIEFLNKYQDYCRGRETKDEVLRM